jgi:predicted nucleic acid-binding protein
MSEVLTLDTNFVQALLDSDHVHYGQAIDVLVNHADAKLTICPIVYCEALCIPNITSPELQVFLDDFGIEVDWKIPQQVWFEAGLARAAHLKFRSQGTNKRFIADFLIGAYANFYNVSLCTFDPRGFRATFPQVLLLP